MPGQIIDITILFSELIILILHMNCHKSLFSVKVNISLHYIITSAKSVWQTHKPTETNIICSYMPFYATVNWIL